MDDELENQLFQLVDRLVKHDKHQRRIVARKERLLREWENWILDAGQDADELYEFLKKNKGVMSKELRNGYTKAYRKMKINLKQRWREWVED